VPARKPHISPCDGLSTSLALPFAHRRKLRPF
jgi:hypothetical protein